MSISNDDILMIRGEKKFERKDEKENFHFVERSFGTFQRAVQLPSAVDPEKVQATFENGVLTVTLPKNAQQQRSRRIQVQSGGQKQVEGTSQSSSQTGGQGEQQSSDVQVQKDKGAKPTQAA